MSIKDILVHVDASEGGANRIDTAVALAADQDSHLIGLFLEGTPYLPPMPDLAQLPPEYLEQQKAFAEEESATAEALFNKKASSANLSYEYRSQEGQPVEILLTNAKYCDLVILGKRDPEGPLDMGDYPDSVILSVGRPVLVVPNVGKVRSLGERVMVGWDNSAQATRAVHDALPLMKKAEVVDVIAINPSSTGEHGEEPCADISRHLARHGVNVQAQSMNVSDIGVADLLLSRAADKGIDLFVMGAYGHARWRELVLGGVTAHMLENMTMPVLMAH